ncbi:MAG: hypothetical protein KR126chlam5_01280 [Candidatus Anoxychlamydiales bacterium]|nr:hypothetical protein [Candidatus Anoxychlamydiales bacterium]
MINLKTIAFSATKGALMGAAFGSAIGSVQSVIPCGISEMINKGPSISFDKGEILVQFKASYGDLFSNTCIALAAGGTGVIGTAIGATAGLIYGTVKSFFYPLSLT